MARKYKYDQKYIDSINDLLIKKDDGSYIQKTGDDFINASKEYITSKLSEKKSSNLNLYTKEQVKSCPLLGDFKFSGIKDFKLLGKLSYEKLNIAADKTYKNQKLYVDNLNDDN